MVNIILQHYTGNLGELEIASKSAFEKYADMVGAEYHLIRGNKFNIACRPPLQKLHMLSEEFDDYDTTLMVDIDMFPVKNLKENIFEIKGYGKHTPLQKKLRSDQVRRFPLLASESAPYWGGAVYKLPRDIRQRLRKEINLGVVMTLNGKNINDKSGKGDEGVMHYLAMKAGIGEKDVYLPDDRWSYNNFDPNPEKAGFIHIRKKIKPEVKSPKIDNYRNLLEKGVI